MSLEPSVELPLGHGICEGRAEMGGGMWTRVGAVAGVPYGATKRAMGVPQRAGWRNADLAA